MTIREEVKKLSKELIGKINVAAREDLSYAEGMLNMANEIYGTDYFFINRRVSYETFEHGVKTFHDAYIWAE